MIRAILHYSNGLSRLQWVDSEPGCQGQTLVNDYVNDGETVFEYHDEFKGLPVYKELDVNYEDFYGYEKNG